MRRFFALFLCVIFGVLARPAAACAFEIAQSAAFVPPARALQGVEAWLAQNEKPLPRSVREQIRVIVVVPVYREWQNGNLLRLLWAFAHQTASPQSYELVLVVNNTPGANHVAKRDNQKSLRFLEELSADEESQDAHARALIGTLKARGLRVRVIDKATEGMERNIGAVRDVGVLAALGQYDPGQYSQIAVAQFDADTMPRYEYVEDIQTAFSDPDVDVGIFAMDITVGPGAQKDVFETHFFDQSAYSDWDFECVLTGKSPGSGTPRIVARASQLVKAGGVPHIAYGEDAGLLQVLRDHTPFRLRSLWRHSVITADRARADGYDAAGRLSGLGRRPRFSRKTITKHRLIEGHIERLRARLPRDEVAVLDGELMEQTGRLLTAQTRSRDALEWLLGHLEKNPGVHPGDVPEVAVLHPWMVATWFVPYLSEQLAKWRSVAKTADVLSRRFGGFFGGSVASRAWVEAKRIARQKALYRVFSLAREYPHRFPGVSEYLAYAESFGSDENPETFRSLVKAAPSEEGDAKIRRMLSFDAIPVGKKFSAMGSAGIFQRSEVQKWKFLEWIPPTAGWGANDWIAAWNIVDFSLVAEGFFIRAYRGLGKTNAAQAEGLKQRRLNDIRRYLATHPGDFQTATALLFLVAHDREALENWGRENPDRLGGLLPAFQRLRILCREWPHYRHGVRLGAGLRAIAKLVSALPE